MADPNMQNPSANQNTNSGPGPNQYQSQPTNSNHSIIRERQMMHPAHTRLVFRGNHGSHQGGQGHGPMSNHNHNASNNLQNLSRGSGPFYGGLSKATGIPPEPPKQPQKPLNANNRWAQATGIYDMIKQNRPRLRGWEVNKEANAMWKELSQEEKQPFIDEHEAEKAEFGEKMIAYYQSPEYQNYQNYINLARNQPNLESITDGRFKGLDLDELYAIEPAKVGTKHKHPTSGGFAGEDDELDLRDIANKRFRLNHDLMLEVFDPRTVVRGWGSDEKAAAATIVEEHDTANVLKDSTEPGFSNYIGAGMVCNIPTITQVERLKNRRKALEDILSQENENLDKCQKIHDQKMRDYEKRSEINDKNWEKICKEKPEETFAKWKKEHDAKMADYQKQREKDEEEKKKRISEEAVAIETPGISHTTELDGPGTSKIPGADGIESNPKSSSMSMSKNSSNKQIEPDTTVDTAINANLPSSASISPNEAKLTEQDQAPPVYIQPETIVNVKEEESKSCDSIDVVGNVGTEPLKVEEKMDD